MAALRILIVDDDKEIVRLLGAYKVYPFVKTGKLAFYE